jgi:SAM-dependent methyltransferase
MGMLMGSLYHREDRLRVLNVAKRVLKKDGLLFSVGFHTPLRLPKEVESVGIQTIQKYAIEGVIWVT